MIGCEHGRPEEFCTFCVDIELRKEERKDLLSQVDVSEVVRRNHELEEEIKELKNVLVLINRERIDEVRT